MHWWWLWKWTLLPKGTPLRVNTTWTSEKTPTTESCGLSFFWLHLSHSCDCRHVSSSSSLSFFSLHLSHSCDCRHVSIWFRLRLFVQSSYTNDCAMRSYEYKRNPEGEIRALVKKSKRQCVNAWLVSFSSTNYYHLRWELLWRRARDRVMRIVCV